MRPTRWRRSTHVLIGVAVLFVVAAVVAAAALLSGGASTSDAAIKPLPAPVTADPGVRPLGDSAPEPTPDGLAAALAPALADPNLGILTGRITDAVTGAELWSQDAGRRSEEHTSELQSRENLVCRLLLEKKKDNIRIHE